MGNFKLHRMDTAEQGAWDALLLTLFNLGLTDDWQHTIDCTSVRDLSLDIIVLDAGRIADSC